MSKLDKEKLFEIKEQIEYYLSDENLKHDSFFHQKISADPNGYLYLDELLKCNKIKKAGWTKEDLRGGIEQSTLIELDKETKDKVRRKDNKPLPDLVLLSKKRKKEESKNEKEEEDEKEEREPVILLINCKEKNETKWKDICETFKEESPDVEVIYMRFKDTEGHIAVIPKTEEVKFKEKFVCENNEYTVKKCEGDDLVEFFKNHGSHYEMCKKMNERKNKRNKNKKQNKKKKKENKKVKVSTNDNCSLKSDVTLGGKKYGDVAVIKAESRRIINDSKDGEPLNEQDQKFILDLLKYHANYEEKVKNLDYITVGKPEKYESSRCFLVVDKKKEKHDFSVQKCLDNLIKKINE